VILVHQVHSGLSRDRPPEEACHLARAREITRQDEVSHQEPAAGDAIAVQRQIPDLTCISVTDARLTST
jgi:hypothetical protein